MNFCGAGINTVTGGAGGSGGAGGGSLGNSGTNGASGIVQQCRYN
jgi:hypothetical protein